MKHLTSRDKIKDMVPEFLRNAERFDTFSGFDWKGNAKKVKALDTDTCTIEEATAAFGNSSWTMLQCNECDREVEEAVQIGQEPDYDSATAVVCKECLVNALEMFK